MAGSVGTGITFNGVLVKCTTGYGLPPGTTPVYAYDASASLIGEQKDDAFLGAYRAPGRAQ